MTTVPTSVLDAWHHAVRLRDARCLDSVLADEVVFFSAVAPEPVKGKKEAVLHISAAFKVFFNQSFRYVRESHRENHAVLEFELEVDGTPVNGVDIITWNEESQITQLKVMLRPLSAINTIHRNMGRIIAGAKQVSR